MRTGTSGLISLIDSRISSPEEGLERQVLAFTERVMLVRHVLRAGWQGSRHSHPHEQLVYVIRGRVRFLCGDEACEMTAGDSLVVPGGVEHQATALEDSEVVDVFAPFREDYAREAS